MIVSGAVSAVWALLSIALGLAAMAYLRTRTMRAAFAAAGAVWVPLTVGMGVWAWQDSLPFLLIALDSFVNLLALLGAAFGGKWTQQATA